MFGYLQTHSTTNQYSKHFHFKCFESINSFDDRLNIKFSLLFVIVVFLFTDVFYS